MFVYYVDLNYISQQPSCGYWHVLRCFLIALIMVYYYKCDKNNGLGLVFTVLFIGVVNFNIYSRKY